MFHKIPLFILSFFLVFSSLGYTLEHFEHYRHLTLQGQIAHIKDIVIENEEYLSFKSYQDLLFHIHVAQEILNQVD